MSAHTLNMTPALYEYYQRMSLREPEILQELRAQTRKMSMGQMQISPEQGQFMQFLVRILQAKRALDIGTFTGYSALSVALALPADGKVIACDKNSEWTKIARQFWQKAGVENKIDLHLAPALTTLENLQKEGCSGTFDFAFIDADKANYLRYYELSYDLVRPGGVIAIDNVLWDGDVADPAIQDENTQMIRRVNEVVLRDERVTMSMLPIGDGLTLVLKNFTGV